MTQLSLFECDKRWRGRQEQWVTPGDCFTPLGYAVDSLEEARARTFVEQHHYSGTFPAARISVGTWGPGPSLVGTAVFSVPMAKAVLPRWTGHDHTEAMELGRFVCDPSVKFNGETWFLRRAFEVLRQARQCRAATNQADSA